MSTSAIIIIPSPLVRASSYQWIVHDLRSRGYRVHVPELPGSGGAQRLLRSWSFADYACWVERYIQSLNLCEGAILIGHSNSAPIAARVAMKQLPIRALILHSPTGARKHSYVQVLLGRAIDALIEFELTFSKGHHVLLNLIQHTRNFLHQVVLSIRCDERRIFEQLSIPTLLAVGRQDHTMPPRDWPLLREAMPDAQMYICETGSHDWMITNRSEFLYMLESWIESLENHQAKIGVTTFPATSVRR